MASGVFQWIRLTKRLANSYWYPITVALTMFQNDKLNQKNDMQFFLRSFSNHSHVSIHSQ